MNLNKHLEFFNPVTVTKPIHIIGCGAIGSYLALQLVKLGVEKIHLWDFDIVEEHNLTNQVYDTTDLNQQKTIALMKHLANINPRIEVIKHGKYTDENLEGYIFLAVDSVELRKQIIETNQFNMNIELLIDSRIGLTSGQVFIAKWNKSKDIEGLLNFCQFKDSEVEVPVSACGTTLSVLPTVLTVSSFAVSSFINYIRTGEYNQQIHIDAFSYKTKAYSFGIN